jgi:hypothetical protein
LIKKRFTISKSKRRQAPNIISTVKDLIMNLKQFKRCRYINLYISGAMKKAAKTYINSIKPNKKGLLVLIAIVVFLPVVTALLFESSNVAPYSLLMIFFGGLLMLAMSTLCYHIVYFKLKHIFVTFVSKNMSHKK